MLNLTASMAVATKHLARTGFRPKGTLLYFAVADEEAGGHWGAEWALDHEPDAVAADYVITESGGLVMDTQAGQKVTITVAEKGVDVAPAARPRHARARLGALRCRQRARQGGRGRAPARGVPSRARRSTTSGGNYVDALDLDRRPAQGAASTPTSVVEACAHAPDHGMAKLAHACTHTTFSPNVVHGGVKTNVIPDVVDLDVDIRRDARRDERGRAGAHRCGARRSQQRGRARASSRPASTRGHRTDTPLYGARARSRNAPTPTRR